MEQNGKGKYIAAPHQRNRIANFPLGFSGRLYILITVFEPVPVKSLDHEQIGVPIQHPNVIVWIWNQICC